MFKTDCASTNWWKSATDGARQRVSFQSSNRWDVAGAAKSGFARSGSIAAERRTNIGSGLAAVLNGLPDLLISDVQSMAEAGDVL